MSVKAIYFLAAFLLIIQSGGAVPPPSYQNNRSAPVKEDPNAAIRQIKTTVADLKHEVSNHEAEIRIFEEKLQNQESSFEQLRQQLIDDLQAQKDFVKASNINLEGKAETSEQRLNQLDVMAKGLADDLRQLKNQANDSVNVLGQYKQKLSELEKLLENQNQHMQNLETTLQSMVEVMQAKQSAKDIAKKIQDGGLTYKVQPGDSLEKIARTQKVSIQALKEANQLNNDKIIVGQTLKIPQ